nr:hypothetical protein [Haloferax sp. BAB-2207]
MTTLGGMPSASIVRAKCRRRSRVETSASSSRPVSSAARVPTDATSIWRRRGVTGSTRSVSSMPVAVTYFRTSCATSLGRYASRPSVGTATK